MPTTSKKVVIVGAGVSGLYAAWRLCVDTPTLDPADIVILEQSNRTGGRLYTWTLNRFDPRLPKDPTVRAELGGMRILNYNLYAYSLALTLNLELVSFPADVDCNWHYLRGQVFQSSSYPEQTAYPLPPGEQGWTPGDVVHKSLVTNGGIVPAEQLPTLDGRISQRNFVDWVLTNTKVQGQPSYQFGFWNTLVGSGAPQPGTSGVSYQAYAYFTEAGAYDTIPSNWNASVAFSNALSDFSNNPTYWAVRDGYEQIPNRLCEALQAANPDMIQLNTQVSGIGRANDGTIQVQTAGGDTYTAEKLILALPPRAMEILAGRTLPGLEALLQPVPLLQSTPVPLFKIFLVYDSDWWSEALGGAENWPAFTRMTTDMPMRQIYNFGSTQGPDGKTYHLLQAAYNDGLKAGYWAGLLPSAAAAAGADVDTDLFGRIINNDPGQSTTLDTGHWSFNTKQPVADYPLFGTMHQQFVELVGQVAASQGQAAPAPVLPVAGSCLDWATDPFGGGVNFWNVGVDVSKAYWDVMNPAESVYVIGEGYSLYQGWVEGALWSAEDMLNKHLGLTPPAWVSTTPYNPAPAAMARSGEASLAAAPVGHVPANAAGQGRRKAGK
jgi:monoamine oxidase